MAPARPADDLLLPPPLVPGSVVRVVAPASPFELPLLWRGMGWLATRYRVRFDRGIFERRGYLAGTDARRAAELEAAFDEPDVAAILCARGGYGSSRFAHRLDWTMLRDHPRWIVGFSDNTVLHVEALAHGVASIHGIHVNGLGRGDARARCDAVDALEDPLRPRRFRGLRTLVPGEASGRLFSGNLAMVHACAAAGRLRLPPNTVLLIEDVGERPYRIDRMLATLKAGGHLATVVAVVLGEFVDCAPGRDGVTVEQLAAELLGDLGVPVACGAPVGHGRVNEPVVVGSWARLVAGSSGAELAMCGAAPP